MAAKKISNKEESTSESTQTAAKSQISETPQKIEEALFIKSRSSNGFYRCGMKFTPDGVRITRAIAEQQGWGEEEVRRLMDDPDLICKEVEIESDEDGAEG